MHFFVRKNNPGENYNTLCLFLKIKKQKLALILSAKKNIFSLKTLNSFRLLNEEDRILELERSPSLEVLKEVEKSFKEKITIYALLKNKRF